MELSDFCEELSEALKEKGHEGVLYNLEGDKAMLVSDKAEYKVIRQEGESEIDFEITCVKGLISYLYDYTDNCKGFDNRRFSPKEEKILLGINKLTLKRICTEISHALRKEKHKEVSYEVEEDTGRVVSNKAEYVVVRREDESQTVFEVQCKTGKIDDMVYDYFRKVKSSSFGVGTQSIRIGISKK